MSAGDIVMESRGPNILVRLLWLVLVGWWIGALVSAVAWFFIGIIVGLPIGLWLIDRLPSVITLRPQEQSWRLEGDRWRRGKEQRSFWLRAVYFVVVGWWLSGLWMSVAYLALLSLIGLPLSFWMYGRIGAVTTLYRS